MAKGGSGAGSRGVGPRSEKGTGKDVGKYIDKIEKETLKAKDKADEIMANNITNIPPHVVISLNKEKQEILEALKDAKTMLSQGYLKGRYVSDSFLSIANGYINNFHSSDANSPFYVNQTLDLRTVGIKGLYDGKKESLDEMKKFVKYISNMMNGVINKYKYYEKKK